MSYVSCSVRSFSLLAVAGHNVGGLVHSCFCYQLQSMDRLDVLPIAAVSGEVVGEIAINYLIERGPESTRREVAYPVQFNRGNSRLDREELLHIIVHVFLGWNKWNKEVVSVDEHGKLVDSSISEQTVLVVQRLGEIVHLHVWTERERGYRSRESIILCTLMLLLKTGSNFQLASMVLILAIHTKFTKFNTT